MIRYNVLEFTANGAKWRYQGASFEEAQKAYAPLLHGMLQEQDGSFDSEGRIRKGTRAENTVLARKAFGKEQF